MKATYRAVTLVFSLIILSPAYAGFYFGGSGGASEKEYTDVKDGSAYKIFAGYKFENNVAIDIAYLNSGEMDIDLNNTVFQGNNLYLQFQGMSYSAAYYLTMPNSKGWYMSGKVGLYDIKSTLKSRNTGNEITDNTTGLGWGIGLGYMFFSHLSLGFDFEGYAGVEDFSDNRILTLIVGSVAYHF